MTLGLGGTVDELYTVNASRTIVFKKNDNDNKKKK